jgi:hypothetical protein
MQLMKRTVFILVTLCIALFTSSVAQAGQLTSKFFSWNGELVTLDENARTVTVKAPLATDQTLPDFARLKTGDRIALRWSGYDDYADSIYRVAQPAEMAQNDSRFIFSVDFVAVDNVRRYVTFKVQIPQDGVASLKSLKPGEWVTATSPHGPSSKTTPVVSIRPYALGANSVSSK